MEALELPGEAVDERFLIGGCGPGIRREEEIALPEVVAGLGDEGLQLPAPLVEPNRCVHVRSLESLVPNGGRDRRHERPPAPCRGDAEHDQALARSDRGHLRDRHDQMTPAEEAGANGERSVSAASPLRSPARQAATIAASSIVASATSSR